jgi:hypothetical protein
MTYSKWTNKERNNTIRELLPLFLSITEIYRPYVNMINTLNRPRETRNIL